MAGPTVPLKNASDSYVSEKYPNRNYSNAQKLFLADGSATNTRYSFIYFGLPSGIFGSSVTRGILRVYSGAGFSGSVTLTVQRVTAKFSSNRVTWNNKPAVTTTGQVSLTKTSPASGTVWEFDITSMLQTIANGAAWYGLRISATGSAAKWLYSAQAADQYRPELDVAWSDSPDQPERLIPDNGQAVSVAKPTLQWDFVDDAGDQTLQSAGIRIFGSQSDADANINPVLDITVPVTEPEFDLDDPAASAWGGMSVDMQRWWRVRNTDGAGMISAWSDTATFVRKAKGTLSITNPASGSPAFVNDNTPPFSWTFTGRTQVKYEAIVTTPETPGKYLWRSGVIPSTETSVTPPPGIITQYGKTYRVVIRIYDDQNRVTVPDDPIYVEATRDFVYQFSSSVSKVTNLVGTPDALGNYSLEWDDGTAPDEYVFLRDGKQFDTGEAVDLLVSGTHYKYVDDGASPRKPHTWEVARKVNGVTSSGNPTSTGTPKVVAPLLTQKGGGKPVLFLNPDVAADRVESSDIHYILGSAPPVLITQSIRGYEGSVTGVLASNVVSGLTADNMLDNLEWFKDNPGVVCKFLWVNQSLQIVIRNITSQPLSYPDGTIDYVASFDFFEVGF